jgi:hypothetical protein
LVLALVIIFLVVLAAVVVVVVVMMKVSGHSIVVATFGSFSAVQLVIPGGGYAAHHAEGIL